MSRFCLIILVVSLTLIPTYLFAEDVAPIAAEGDAAAMMQQWMEFAKPGPPHQQMARLVGKWKTVTSDFSNGPDEPSVSEGTATFESILGGRYLRQEFSGNYGGMPMHGLGIQGYDNSQKKYVGTWIDNFGTGIMHTEGTYDPATHMMTETGKASCPTGPMSMKMVTVYKSNDEFEFTMYMIMPDGTEQRQMQIQYTRQ
jgi:hypothetical protein